MRIARDAVLANRYRLEECLGQGGMGSVWRAVDLRLDRLVAIKLASAAAGSRSGVGQLRRRLRREAEALAALSEPHIARVYDLVENECDVCLVMELIEGESLAARLKHPPPLTTSEALEIAGQCAQALQAAHRIGIVHRDVKPSNIMLGPDGVKVVDFGIAARIGQAGADTTVTMPRSVVGTAAYLAPERAVGAAAGGEADFYSLGVVLYQMLAMHLPFHADESLAMLYAHARAAPEPLPVDVPAPAAALCLRMLSKDPEQRPTSVREIRSARDALDGVRADVLVAVSASPSAAPTTAVTEPRTRIGGLVPAGRRFGRRGMAMLPTAVFSIAAALAAAAAWILLDQPANAGAIPPAPVPRSAVAPGVVVLPPSVGHITLQPVAKATPVHAAPAKERRHPGEGKHTKSVVHGHGHGHDRGNGNDHSHRAGHKGHH